MEPVELGMVVAGPDPVAILRALATQGLVRRERPAKLGPSKDVGDDWFERLLAGAGKATWADQGMVILRADHVHLTLPEVRVDPSALVKALAAVPFELASFTTLYPAWARGEAGPRYYGPNWGDKHTPLGWGCAFRGAGHDRLVSRRWLDAGPWRVLHAANDTTMVQFHELTDEPADALQQAMPGHRLMSLDDEGGVLQKPYLFTTDLRSLYSKQQQTLIFTVKGRRLSAVEMRDAAAARILQPFGAEVPIKNCAFVFFAEDDAHAELDELWLRGLEVRLVGKDGLERRIDGGYRPRARSKPAWVVAADG